MRGGAATMAEVFRALADEQFASKCGPAVRRLVKVVLPEYVNARGMPRRVVEGDVTAILHFDRSGEPSRMDVQGSDERLVQEVRRAVGLWRASALPDGAGCGIGIGLAFNFRRH
jgi:hypothetical protein